MADSTTSKDKPLAGRVCLVTGASRGIGRGIALQLGEAGATVYITGRTLEPKEGAAVGGSLRQTADEVSSRGGVCHPVKCDHSNETEIEALFERIKQEQDGRLDILVNNAYSAVTKIMSNLNKPFWEQDVSMWDDVNNVGLRNHYICAVYAARLMVPRKGGLIVNISSAGGIRYIFNVAYGVGKEALDRMAADMAHELRRHGVACVSLWPGAVKTEEIMHAVDSGKIRDGFKDNKELAGMEDVFLQGESTEYAGKAVVALALDEQLMAKSGRIHLTPELGSEYGFTDIDGRSIMSLRAMKNAFLMAGFTRVARFMPSFVKVPYWMLALGGNKF